MRIIQVFYPLMISAFIFCSCDCIQKVDGIILDRQTNSPVSNVLLGKYDLEDSAHSSSVRTYSDEQGRFNFQSISGGFRNCPDIVLHFSKSGYKKMRKTFEVVSVNDTVYLEKE